MKLTKIRLIGLSTVNLPIIGALPSQVRADSWCYDISRRETNSSASSYFARTLSEQLAAAALKVEIPDA